MSLKIQLAAMVASIGLLSAPVKAADIKIGLTLSATGPAASLGVPQKNTVALLPTEVAGHKVRYIVLDDAGDGTKSVENARKMIAEDNIDVLIGSTVTPSTLPLIDIAAETKTPLIANVPATRTVSPVDEKRRWVFKVIQSEGLLAGAIVEHMVKAGVKTVGFVGFSDAYGESYYAEFSKAFADKGITIVAKESFARSDTSVAGQVLKLIAAHPDVVLVAAAGTPAIMPAKALKERGYHGQVYQTAGISTMDFIRVGGKDVEGTLFSAGPIVIASQLPDGNPIKAGGLDYIKHYEDTYKTSFAAFGAHITDASTLILQSVPAALKAAQPGTPEFRSALRDAIENAKGVVLNHGIVTMSPTDHNGLDERARVMVRIENGAWKLVP